MKTILFSIIGLLTVASALDIQTSATVLRSSGSYSGASRSTTSYTKSYSYTPSTTVVTYNGGYHGYSYGYGYTYVSTGGGGAVIAVVSILSVCFLIGLIICFIVVCGSKNVKHQEETVITETIVTTEVNNGPQAVQVSPPYPPTYPGGPVTPWCKNNHQMTWVQGNPYSH